MWTEYTLKDLGVYNQILNGTEKKHFLMYVCTYIHAYKHTHRGKENVAKHEQLGKATQCVILAIFHYKNLGDS